MQNIQMYDNPTFSKTMDNKNNMIGKYLENLVMVRQKSRQSMEQINSFKTHNSNQVSNSMQSIKFMDEEVS